MTTKKDPDMKYIADLIRKKDSSFLLNCNEMLEEISNCLCDFSYKTKTCQDNPKKSISSFEPFDFTLLSRYFKDIDYQINILEKAMSFYDKKICFNFLGVGGFSILSAIINPVLAIFILIIGGYTLGSLFSKNAKEIKELLAAFYEANDELATYAPLVSEYETNYVRKQNLPNNNYEELIALISSTDKEHQKKYLERLKRIYHNQKGNKWNLFTATTALKEEIFAESRDHLPDYNFIVTNLLNYLESLNDLDRELINSILYYAKFTDDPERFYLETSQVCIKNIATNIRIMNLASCQISGVVATRFSEIPEYLYGYLEGYLIENLAGNEEFQKLIQNNHPASNQQDTIRFLLSAITIYIQNKQELNRKLATN